MTCVGGCGCAAGAFFIIRSMCMQPIAPSFFHRNDAAPSPCRCKQCVPPSFGPRSRNRIANSDRRFLRNTSASACRSECRKQTTICNGLGFGMSKHLSHDLVCHPGHLFCHDLCLWQQVQQVQQMQQVQQVDQPQEVQQLQPAQVVQGRQAYRPCSCC